MNWKPLKSFLTHLFSHTQWRLSTQDTGNVAASRNHMLYPEATWCQGSLQFCVTFWPQQLCCMPPTPWSRAWGPWALIQDILRNASRSGLRSMTKSQHPSLWHWHCVTYQYSCTAYSCTASEQGVLWDLPPKHSGASASSHTLKVLRTLAETELLHKDTLCCDMWRAPHSANYCYLG